MLIRLFSAVCIMYPMHIDNEADWTGVDQNLSNKKTGDTLQKNGPEEINHLPTEGL